MEIEPKRFGDRRWLIGLAAAALALAGCGGSGGGSADMTAAPTATPSACADCGTLMVGLTDADGDFVSYSVDVLSIKLQRANGALNLIPPICLGTVAHLKKSLRLSVFCMALISFLGTLY